MSKYFNRKLLEKKKKENKKIAAAPTVLVMPLVAIVDAIVK